MNQRNALLVIALAFIIALSVFSSRLARWQRDGQSHAPTENRGALFGTQPSKASGPTGSSGPVYQGPSKNEKWISSHSDDAWSVEKGSLVASGAGGVARKIWLPPKSKVGFDLVWDRPPHMEVLLRANNGPNGRLDNYYRVRIVGQWLLLSRQWDDSHTEKGVRTAGGSIVAEAKIPELQRGQEARLEFLLDQDDGRIAILVNNRRVDLREYGTGLDGPLYLGLREPEKGDYGNWLHFITKDSRGIRISNLVVDRWDGALPAS